MKLILLIDDSDEIRTTFGHVLRSRGYEVIESNAGEAGLELARQRLPDLILSDIHMPGGDGEALLDHIRNDPELCSKQVVLMTGRPDLVSPRRGMEQGADDFLLKPVTSQALLSCVKARLSRADVHWRIEDQAITRFRSSMPSQLPHEFFTPLAGILGLSEIIRSDSSLAPAEIQDLNKEIHQSAQRLHRTLRNYLLILEGTPAALPTSPPESLPADRVHDSLNRAVENVLQRHDRREDLNTTWAAVPLLVDALDLTVMMEELLDNAFKFSRRGSPVHARLKEGGQLEIIDEGRGMPAAEISKIGAFRQFDRATYEQQGLGLGLSLVQKLAARNDAEFKIEGAEKGIRVTLRFR